ncbi:sulfite exporter TauE/SafE family protein [Pseudorhodobacter sp.]|uniref:sulfite exporter TauE/SafE family protein n=1 Tax=Pseudorhodobacter sp. TaxID=1934400 RepID=UPI002648554D|nr:sulfite exporter TauE/SafE family protein [Pseudorhodobacter sp.]MDN5786254.1 sulfite exporter TauE/SafE family protein [Pseudorhodobacter sp.]
MLSYVVLILAGFVAGVLNAVAGGGTFISFPALVWFGIPPISANATATLTALPGYFTSAWAYRKDIKPEGALSLKALLALSVAGGVIGALLLIFSSSEGFSALVPWLLLIATALFALGPYLLAALRQRGRAGAGVGVTVLVILSVSIYGGYFNGGLGIMLLAAFGLVGFTNLHGMNGLKNLFSALLALVSCVAFIAAGIIAWKVALPMAISTATGGFIGARLARRVTRTDLLRHGITVVGLVMTVLFFLK